MARPLWKGAISFGLVTIPVSLYTATRTNDLRFRQLDKQDNSVVREKRVSEESGREVPWDDVVKGYEYEEGSFVVLDPDDFTKANVKASETIDIAQAVPRDAIPPEYFEKPLYVVPTKTGIKPYHILREVLRRTDRAAVATIVMRGKQHLAALLPGDEVLLLELLHFAHEIKGVAELEAGAALEPPDIKPKELELAEQLVSALDAQWEPEAFRDEYREDLLALIEEKAKTGQAPARHAEQPKQGGEVVDMMELLKKSVGEARERKGKGQKRKAS
jgi:DNA end-binding protein Ku